MTESIAYRSPDAREPYRSDRWWAIFTGLPGVFYFFWAVLCVTNPKVSFDSAFFLPYFLFMLAGIYVMPFVMLICLIANFVRLARSTVHILPLAINFLGAMIGGFAWFALRAAS